MATEYKPRDEVPASGIYRVRHDRHHAEHEVTCVKGRRSSFNPWSIARASSLRPVWQSNRY
jgi:hypothetical protein